MDDSDKKYISKEKKKELEDELSMLKTTKRKEIAEALEYAKSLGDLSENAEYHQARENQASIEERILIIENILKIATIVSGKQTDHVSVGSRVTILDEKSGDKETWEIVGSEEADLAQSKVSNESPLGGSLIGKREGDVAELKISRGKRIYKVLKIE